ncbi:(2Fe-2S)-binding protein [Cupriavidus basilensis]
MLRRRPQYHLRCGTQARLTTPAEITACVKAGGNCGSCVPELKRLLVEIRVAEAA